MVAGLVMVGCGGYVPPDLRATQGEAEITLTWENCEDLSSHTITFDTSPFFDNDPQTDSTTEDTFSHDPGDVPYFYKVSGCSAKGMDLIAGGHTDGFSSGSDLRSCLDFIQQETSCFSDHRDSCYPDTFDVAGKQGIWDGADQSGGGEVTMAIHINVDLAEGIYADVAQDWNGMYGLCSDGVSQTGEAITALIIGGDDADDGWSHSTITYGNLSSPCTGDTWIQSVTDIAARKGSGGAYYIGSGSTVQYFPWEASMNYDKWEYCSNETFCDTTDRPPCPEPVAIP
jgi:hypothetical protein